MDGGSAPPAPDYKGAAEATAQGNLDNLNAQTAANRPNQYTPWGSSTWAMTPTVDQAGYDNAMKQWQAGNSQGTWVPATAAGGHFEGSGEGGQWVTDPATEGHWVGGTSSNSAMPDIKDYTTNQWSQTLQLTPDQQKALDNQMQIQANQSDLAKTLQGQVASTMAGGFNSPQLSDYLKGIGSINQQFGGFTPYGVGQTDQSQINPNFYTAGNRNVNQTFRSGAQGVDLNAPQFNQDTVAQGQKAAYDAATGLMQPQMDQDRTRLDNQLRLQGLTPGTEAYNNAAQNLQRTQDQTLSQIANQSVITGNQLANTNYASALAGYGAKNTAIGQQYGQDANTFNTTNQARTQGLNNSLLNYQAALQGQNAYNTAQNQGYTQALAGYGANQSAQQLSNQAVQQANQMALGNYSTAYTSALQNYLQPLNNMNAVLSGQQVSMPSMPSFATAGYTPGADQSGATQALGSWNQGIYNSNQASANSTNAAGAGAIAAIAAAFI